MTSILRTQAMNEAKTAQRFPMTSGILFGLGLGGFFDGIVLHQLLQWHHLLSSWYPTNTIYNIEFNTLWDGIFHSATYIFVVWGLVLLWRHARTSHLIWSTKLLIGAMLLGWGLFNVIEGIVDHHLLAIHHVNEAVAATERIYWDLGFLGWGAAMIVAGWLSVRAGRHEMSSASPRRV